MSACARNLLAAFARSLRIGSQRASLVNIRQVFVRLFPVGAETTHAGFSCSLFFQHFFFICVRKCCPRSGTRSRAWPLSQLATTMPSLSQCLPATSALFRCAFHRHHFAPAAGRASHNAARPRQQQARERRKCAECLLIFCFFWTEWR